MDLFQAVSMATTFHKTASVLFGTSVLRKKKKNSWNLTIKVKLLIQIKGENVDGLVEVRERTYISGLTGPIYLMNKVQALCLEVWVGATENTRLVSLQ